MVGSQFQPLPKERHQLEICFPLLLWCPFSSPVCITIISICRFLRKSSCIVRVSWQFTHLKAEVPFEWLSCVFLWKRGFYLFLVIEERKMISPNSIHCYIVKLKFSMILFISIWYLITVMKQEFIRIVLFLQLNFRVKVVEKVSNELSVQTVVKFPGKSEVSTKLA